MDATSANELCRRWLPNWTGGAGSVEGLLSHYAADAFYSDPAQPKGLRGHSELRPYFEKLLSKYPDWKWEVVEIFPTAKGLTLKWRATVGDRQGQGLDIVEVVDGRIVRNEVYFDPRVLFG
jgi:SnoaL-like domain